MSFPTTPRTLLGRLHREEELSIWHASWGEFFDLYHHAIRVCVRSSFAKKGWNHLDETDLEDVVLRVFESFDRAQEKFELNDARGRLRQFLTTLCQRRVVDFIRSQHRHTAGRMSLEDYPEISEMPEGDPLGEEERWAFDQALIGTLLSALREEISPRNYMIFELVKLNEEKPDDVARQFGIKRGVVDNSIYKAMRKLSEIAARADLEEHL